MKPIIEVKKLSKKYRIGEQQPYYTLRDSLAGMFKNPFAAVQAQLQKDEFWALKDINFTVNQGEVVGIIGRNGAGKSTLLKILSQITPPTEGEIILRGRVGSLLEVGTGFSPELTGRENIYLNGAVLGMSRIEVKKKFDEIVAFSEVEKFLDTPLKHYSSGMYMRLAFAVAAHLEPEILIVDEVLAVGDAEFQKKCLGKMGDVAKEGRTVLFVSHNMGAVENLCDKCILITDGKISNYGNKVSTVIKKYLDLHTQKVKHQVVDNEYFTLNHAGISDGSKEKTSYTFEDKMYFNIDVNVKKLHPALQLGYALYTNTGELLYWSNHNDTASIYWPKIKTGRVRLSTEIPINVFSEGEYVIEFISSIYYKEWLLTPGDNKVTMHFSVSGKKSISEFYNTKRPGIIAPVIKWENYET